MKYLIQTLSALAFLTSSSYVSARAKNERYDPYPYLTVNSVSNAFSSSSSNSTNDILNIVSVEAPVSTEDVEYISNVFYANWHSSSSLLKFGIEDIPWDYVGSVTYGFIPVPTSNFANITLTLEDASTIPQLVTLGKKQNVTIILSLGGHLKGGASSAGFEAALATSDAVAQFVKGVSKLVDQTSVGGIEFDWETSTCLSYQTPYTSTDLSSSYLSFLQELRKSLAKDVSISLAVGPVPWTTPSISVEKTDTEHNSTDASNTYSNSTSAEITTITGQYRDVSEFAKVVDWITVLNYDLSGPWTTSSLALPNSPLNATCSGKTSGELPYSVSATTSSASWSLSGFRPDQIVLGVTASAKSFFVGTDFDASASEEGTYPTFSAIEAGSATNSTDFGDAWWWGDVMSASGATGNGTCSLSTLSDKGGVFTFRGLAGAGYLDEEGDAADCDGDDSNDENSGVDSLWDECSETPFLYVKKTGVLISYDDAESMELKGEFILAGGLRGFSLREVGADLDNILLSAIRHGAGFPDDVKCGDDEELTYEDVPNADEGDSDESTWEWDVVLEDALA